MSFENSLEDSVNKCAQPFLIKLLLVLVCVALLGPAAAAQTTPTPGQNVNMVSGRNWPGGDPFLQRQNEPSIAVSTRNPLHLLAGANDYRTVDLPAADIVPGSLAADAWLGVFKSFDGGQTWQSTLLPGYKKDNSAPELQNFTAAADPTVRAGTNGMFYYSGIAFNRGTNLGLIFVCRFIDLNNKENGDVPAGTDPIKYIDCMSVDSGTSGQFIDKPWIAADIPRSGAQPCKIFEGTPKEQSFLAGTLYLVWSRFTGSSSSKIMLSRSLNCGKTWSNPTKVSESNSVNQGTTLAIDPITGNLYLAWRRFKTSSQSDAIMTVVSTDSGKTFTKAAAITPSIIPADQQTKTGQFRTNAVPTIAVSVDCGGLSSRVHVAWSERKAAAGDARIKMATSLLNATGSVSWLPPIFVDDAPIMDDYGHPFDQGHQFMPAMTFTEGKLVILYYDSRLDHTVGVFTPRPQFGPDKFYLEERVRKGDPASSVFGPFVNDDGLQRRHTIDLRLAQAIDLANLTSNSFTYAMVSRYAFGLVNSSTLQQLQVNPPNFPMFAQGTVPFMGDYNDIVGLMFVMDSTGAWKFNTGSTGCSAPSLRAVHYATWTDNRDVVPPPRGQICQSPTGAQLTGWQCYTPINTIFGQRSQSLSDPSQLQPLCALGREGMRNQNIYSSRITQGLLVSSPQNQKPFDTTLTHVTSFVVLVQNLTSQGRTFQLSLPNPPPPGVKASFVQSELPNPVTTTLNVFIPAGSGVAPTVFATSGTRGASITVNVDEVPAGLSSSVTLNPGGLVTDLEPPEGGGASIASGEVYTPGIKTPGIKTLVLSPGIKTPGIKTPGIKTPGIKTPGIKTTSIADLSYDSLTSCTEGTTDCATGLSEENLTNPTFSSDATQNFGDATYELSNNGNTTAAYTLTLVGNPTTPIQIIVTTPGTTFTADSTCQLVEAPQSAVLANITNPTPGVVGSVSVPPNSFALITLRGQGATLSIIQDFFDPDSCSNTGHCVTENTTPISSSLGASDCPTGGCPTSAVLLFIDTPPVLPGGFVNTPYVAPPLHVFDGSGTPPYTWGPPITALPLELTLAGTGLISGKPALAGPYLFRVQVADTPVFPTPQQTAKKTFSLTVQPADTEGQINGPGSSLVNDSVAFAFTVTPKLPAEPTPTPVTGTVTITVSSAVGDPDNGKSCSAGVSAGTGICSPPIIFETVGTKTLTAAYAGDSNFNLSTSPSVVHQVSKANQTITVTTPAPASAVYNTNFSVAATATSGLPVAITTSGVCSGSGSGSATITMTSGTGTCTVHYNQAGNDTYNPAPEVTSDTTATKADAVIVVTPYSVTYSGTAHTATGTATGVESPTPVDLSSLLDLSGTTHTNAGSYATDPWTFAGNTNYNATSGTVSDNIAKADTTATITSDAIDPSILGQPVPVGFKVAANPPGAGTPTGNVTVSDGTNSCTASLSAGIGSCSLTLTTVGIRSLTATYAGDSNFNGNPSAIEPHLVNYNFNGFLSPLNTVAGPLSNPTMVPGTTNRGSVVPLKWLLTDFSGTLITDLSSLTLLQAIPNTACAGPPSASDTLNAVPLYRPTSGAAGGSTFRFSSQFIFNWDTSTTINSAAGCFTVVMQLNDGSAPKALTIKFQ
jgi:hypothetical protein